MRALLELRTQTHSRVIAGVKIAFLLCALTLRAGESAGALVGQGGFSSPRTTTPASNIPPSQRTNWSLIMRL